MHTIKIIALGFSLLALLCLIGYFSKSPRGIATAALVFIPLWFIGAWINLYIGVKRAGYTVAEELPILLVVFLVPALVALLLRWKL